MSISLGNSDTLGDYVIVREMGTARLSTYFLAVHQVKRTSHTIRLMPKHHLIRSHAIRDLFYGELRALKLHDHPSIVLLSDILEDDDYAYIVTSYIAGPRFVDIFLRQRVQEEGSARTAFHQIVNIALFLERNRVPHMFRLENIVQAPAKMLILLEYRSPEDEITQTEERCHGTLRPLFYRAPEILNESSYSSSGNAWACGVALFLLLTGEIPFNPPGHEELLRQHIRKASVKIPYWLSLDAQELLSGLLERQVSKRMALADIPQQAWFAAGILGHEDSSMFWDASSLHMLATSHSNSRRPELQPGKRSCMLTTHNIPKQGPSRELTLSPVFPTLGTSIRPSTRELETKDDPHAERLPSALHSKRLDVRSPPSSPLTRAKHDAEQMREAHRIIEEEAGMHMLRRRTSFSPFRGASSRRETHTAEGTHQRRGLGRPLLNGFLLRERRNPRWVFRIRTPFAIHKQPKLP